MKFIRYSALATAHNTHPKKVTYKAVWSTYEVSRGLMSKPVGMPGTVEELLSVLTAACSVGESLSPRKARYRVPENAYNKMMNMMLNWTTSITTTRKRIRTKAPVVLTIQKQKATQLSTACRYTMTQMIAYIHTSTLGLQ